MENLKVQIHQKLDRMADDDLKQVLAFVEFWGWKKMHEETFTSSLPDKRQDAIVGLFDGPADLAEQSEELLAYGITERSGWSWKEEHL